MDRKAFFDAIRHAPFDGLSPSQVAGIDAVLDDVPSGFPLEHLAYCLATVFHETARTMQPIEEYGRGKGKSYGVPDKETGQTYFGRGLVQLTWRWNYATAGKALGLDLVNHPTLALEPDVAVKIMFRGMTDGWFTAKKLSDYFGPGKSEPREARRIINGTDKADLIAGYHGKFVSALRTAGYGQDMPKVVIKPPDPPPPAKLVDPAKPAPDKAGFFNALARRVFGA